MDNQHRKIKGYRELSQAEIDIMNQIKSMAAEVGTLIAQLEMISLARDLDIVWLSDGKLSLQKGFMSLVRAVAKPEFF